MGMRPAIVVVLVSVGLMTPVTGTFAQPRSAQGACNPNRPSDFPLNRWAGWNVDGRGQTIGGVYARIFNYVPYVDPVSQGDFVYTWTSAVFTVFELLHGRRLLLIQVVGNHLRQRSSGTRRHRLLRSYSPSERHRSVDLGHGLRSLKPPPRPPPWGR